jgi:hypothetical protein
MIIDRQGPTIFTIKDLPDLDEITVVLLDFAPGRGRVVIECFGKAWGAYWSNMQGLCLREFLVSSELDYLIKAFLSPFPRNTEEEREYLGRILVNVQAALRHL